MEKVLYGLTIMLLGMIIVFVVLFLLIIFVKGSGYLFQLMEERRARVAHAKEASSAPVAIAYTPAAALESEDEIFAVIGAVIAAVAQAQGTPEGLVVRSIRRVGATAPIWNRVARAENNE